MEGHDEQRLIAALQDHTRDVEGLLAENFALQALLLRIASASAEKPDLHPLVREAFDDAASFVRRECLERGRMLEALEVIERLRLAFKGPGKSPSRTSTRF